MSHALTFPVPAAGSLDQYIQSVNRMPMLSEQQEVELATRLRDEGDVDAARQLVMSHLRVVVAIARGYLGYGLPHADLIQEGNVGLMKAVKRFDPSRGVRLVSFAIHWIKAEIHEYILKNWRLVKIATTKAQRKLFFNLRGMKKDSTTLQPAEVQAIAAQLDVKPEEVVEMETRLTGRDIPLDAGSDDEDERFAPISYLPDPQAEPSELIAEAQLAHLQDTGLRNALASLDDRSRAIVQRRWLAEGDSATLHELAAEYGVSAERIRQIEAKAMQKMRGMLAAVV
ncbi:RNA polymerase sigma factor RpoH [Thauera mechernichensis]|uniref:RNA polymerase sigma factor RpoH n=1 Tax=Thauera mechernichensis TaxID=82788 RepID=A0ABW3WBV5_9RHOO|nr:MULTISPECIES: RNA polymerase sigma factor RpoH [Thauera]MDG3065527.1 RNA polymerase sigma factor RpoH [Thauera mechernichensis]WBL65107.1 RNA polymerase sigma factor RpoH [Thauera sp. WB-2]HRJ25687.1 RNA polymerase sigma factor RpoH [Thauera sp.]